MERYHATYPLNENFILIPESPSCSLFTPPPGEEVLVVEAEAAAASAASEAAPDLRPKFDVMTTATSAAVAALWIHRPTPLRDGIFYTATKIWKMKREGNHALARDVWSRGMV